MRQRIFWTIFYLERSVAFNCGSPYLIRETDFKVDLALNLPDAKMFPDQPLPPETSRTLPWTLPEFGSEMGKIVGHKYYIPRPSIIGIFRSIDRTNAIYRCSEIWDVIFGVNAQKPISQEFVASIDARIIYALSQFPAHLQWDRNVHRLTGGTDVPPYLLRQTIILQLRMNQLRLVLRQEAMLNMTYDNMTAEQCVTIATSSINAIYIYLSSKFHRPTDRFSSVLYLVGSLLPLVCLIVKNDNELQTRTQAISAFKQGLSLLNSMAPNFSWARHTLRRIHRIIGTAKRAIEVFDNAGMFALDLTEFFEGDLLAKEQYTDSFNLTNWVNMDKDVLLEQPGSLALPSVRNPNFLTSADEMGDVFWVEDFLKSNRGLSGVD